MATLATFSERLRMNFAREEKESRRLRKSKVLHTTSYICFMATQQQPSPTDPPLSHLVMLDQGWSAGGDHNVRG